MSVTDVGGLPLGDVEFPGRAGTLQSLGATAALVRELGLNYGTYHAYLASELARLGRRPEPDQFESREAFVAAWTRIFDLIRGESILRNCRAYVSSGRRLDAPLDLSGPPLIGDGDRLVSVESPTG